MKKLFISLFMAIGLTGLAMAQTTITVSEAAYYSAKATITLSDADKTAITGADTLLAVSNIADQEALSNIVNKKDPIPLGYQIMAFFPYSGMHTVVYTGKPTIEGSALTLNLLTKPGTDAYLQLYTGKKGEDGKWTYALLASSAAKFQTKKSTITMPEDISGSSMTVRIALDDTMRKNVRNATTLLAVVNPSQESNVLHTAKTRYKVGDYTAKNSDGWGDLKVVYHDTPTFTDDVCEINVSGLEAGESGCLVLCLGTEKDGQWTYTSGFLRTENNFEIAPLNITATEVEYSTLKASVTLDETTKAAYNACAALVAVAAPYKNVPYLTIASERTSLMEVGETMNALPIVFVGKPALTDGSKLEFTCPNLTPGAKVYLNLFFCTESDGAYAYPSHFFAHAKEAAQMKSIPAPTKLTAGTIADGKLPLTIEAAADFGIMIVKSDAVKHLHPKGLLEADDAVTYATIDYDGETNELIRDTVGTGTVVAILEPGVKTYSLPMEAGEACYVHAYAVANAKTDAAAYSPEMAMAPVYRMAEKLPLAYTFSAGDLIYGPYDNLMDMPILPPGLSTTAAPTEEELSEYIASAFFVQILQGETDQHLLWSTYPESSSAGGEDYPGDLLADGDEADGEQTEELRWIDWVTPEFTGVTMVQARFKTMLIGPSPQGYGYAARKVADGDEVRIEYKKNDGEWQAIETLNAANFPAQEGQFYNLTVDVKGFQRTDVVRIRYSYRSSAAMSAHAVAGYEIVEGRNCLAPANLQAVAESITGSAIALSWQDQNVDEPASYMVYYENAEFATANGLVSATAKTATIDELLPGTTYNVRVQAVCGRNDSSFFSAPLAIATAKGIPYSESLASEVNMDGYGPMASFTLVSKPDVTVYAQADLKAENWKENEVDYAHVAPNDMELAQATNSWNTFWCTQNMIFWGEGEFYSMSVPVQGDMALMTTPVISVPEAGAMTLTFKAHPWMYDMDEDEPVYNFDLPADIRLYVLASTDGFATWDTVGTFDHTAFYDENAAEDPDAGIGGYSDEEGDDLPGKLVSVKLNKDKYQGKLQLGFYFRVLGDPSEDFAFLELHSLKLDYDQRIQPYDLAVEADEYSAVIKWKGEGDVYRIYYGLASAENYTDSLDCVARPGSTTQFDTIKNLQDNKDYKVGIISYSKGFTKASAIATTTFTTLEHLYKVTAIVTPEDGGTVEGAGEYFLGRTAELTATASNGYRFVTWKAGETALSTETTLKIKVAGDTTVTAVFEEIPTYTLTLTASPAEGGKVEGADSYKAGANVKIKATANEGYKFVAWKDGNKEVSQNAEHTFNMPEANTTYTAVFEAETEETLYALTLAANPAEGGKVEGANKYHEGDDVTIKATANEGYKFVAWMNEEKELSKEAEYTFKMPAQDVTYTAVFVKETANEAQLQASFTVGTQNGSLYVRNLSGIVVKDIDVYGLTGRLINRFALNSAEDLMLPIDAQRAILFVRLNTEKGVAVYKVYLQ